MSKLVLLLFLASACLALTVEAPDSVYLGGNYSVSGSAKSSTVYVIIISPTSDVKVAQVEAVNGEYSYAIQIPEDAPLGTYICLVLSPGADGEFSVDWKKYISFKGNRSEILKMLEKDRELYEKSDDEYQNSTFTVHVVERNISVFSAFKINRTSSIAKDSLGNLLEITGDAIRFERIGGKLSIYVPVGGNLSEFFDEASKIRITKNMLKVPLEGASGEEIGEIAASVSDVSPSGGRVRAGIKELRLRIHEVGYNFSDIKPKVGDSKVMLDAKLKDIPERAEFRLRLRATVGAEALKEFQSAATKNMLKIRDVAYGVEVEHKNLDADGANITLKVNREWAELHGVENVKVFRRWDGGTDILPTTFAGYEGNQAVFEAKSPGLSIFALVATERVETQTPSPPGFELLVAILALILAMIRRR